ncbi:MAG: hypothetical protein ACI9QQ_002861 [Myxococcota bacterium]
MTDQPEARLNFVDLGSSPTHSKLSIGTSSTAFPFVTETFLHCEHRQDPTARMSRLRRIARDRSDSSLVDAYCILRS